MSPVVQAQGFTPIVGQDCVELNMKGGKTIKSIHKISDIFLVIWGAVRGFIILQAGNHEDCRQDKSINSQEHSWIFFKKTESKANTK